MLCSQSVQNLSKRELEMNSSPPPEPDPPPSFFASLANKTKRFLGIAKQRRYHKQDLKGSK